ncbi:DUF2218 domain-containing protein [Oceanicola sp. D3]|uniref:DUF2218 domain-containing protein n=1 Tax=Oceanicola sp. D3 TaxID=2587163 RepID=UPI001122087E|nr:DUF2218 domain-containing protein [Oceanicola sp. D3]QDC08578.1 DUF2218 domain-containing protein [Oceanicola sp. D3]
MQDPLHDTGTFSTPHGSKYLQQLCKHFAHKIETRFDDTSGECALSPGPATLSADETGLTVHITAPDEEGLAVSRSIIDKHLIRFAFREDFQNMSWAGTSSEG